MGVRKRNKATEVKEAKKTIYMAKLNNCPTSPIKMRLVADLIRGLDVDRALQILKFSTKEPSNKLYKLLLSAMANWQSKNEGVRIEESNLFVKSIHVDSGKMLKRIQPAPQGRAHRIHKHSNHVTLVIDSRVIIIDEKITETVEHIAEPVVKETKSKRKKSTNI